MTALATPPRTRPTAHSPRAKTASRTRSPRGTRPRTRTHRVTRPASSPASPCPLLDYADASARASALVLFDAHRPLAAKLAHSVASSRRIPPCVTHDELENAALVGLWQAAQRWDEFREDDGRGRHSFSGYAAVRVRGAMLDYLRQYGGVSRRQWDEGVRPARQLADPSVLMDATHGVRAGDRPWKSRTVTAAEELEDLLSRVPKRLARVVRRHFIEGRTLTQIARRMRVSLQRVNEMVNEGVRRIAREGRRARMAGVAGVAG